MSAGKSILLVLVVLIIGGLIAGGCAYGGYKHTIALDESVKASWADVEVVLQRRFDLIGNLVNTVKGSKAHEEKVLIEIANARKSYGSAGSVAEKAQAANQMESALSRLLVIVENYPELKANQSFRDLHVSLEGTENRIAEKRKVYNDRVRELNTYIRAFPGSLYAGWAGVTKAEPYKAAEGAKEAPKVEF